MRKMEDDKNLREERNTRELYSLIFYMGKTLIFDSLIFALGFELH